MGAGANKQVIYLVLYINIHFSLKIIYKLNTHSTNHRKHQSIDRLERLHINK
jgi:hypothetical protein